jgi:hypothetical protein
MEFSTIFEKSYSYLDSLIVSMKNQLYDVFIDLHDDDEEEAESNCSLLNETNNSERFDIEEDLKGPMTIDELNSDVIECEEDEDDNLNQHNNAFVLDSSQIDWDDPRNDAYYDPHDNCVEYPSFLHDSDGYGSYGSNYNGGYDSH